MSYWHILTKGVLGDVRPSFSLISKVTCPIRGGLDLNENILSINLFNKMYDI